MTTPTALAAYAIICLFWLALALRDYNDAFNRLNYTYHSTWQKEQATYQKEIAVERIKFTPLAPILLPALIISIIIRERKTSNEKCSCHCRHH